jgi:type I restriction enzyme S subunit
MSITRYEAYKDSGVEWISATPSCWPNLRLKDVIAKLESGVSVNASNEPVEGDNIGVLKTSCVGKDVFLPSQNKSVWPTEIERVCVPVQAGRIIISRMNTPRLVGASSYISKDYPNLFLPDRLWQTVFLANIKLDYKWLSLLIGCSAFRFLLSTLATGTSPSMKNLGQEKFLNISFPFPPLPEQKTITAYLDAKTAQIDRKIDLLSQKATQYSKLKQSLINETVTRGLDKTVPMKDSGVEWIGEVPAHWNMCRLKELSTIQNSNVDKKSHDNEIPVQLCNYVDVYKNEFINSILRTVLL